MLIQWRASSQRLVSRSSATAAGNALESSPSSRSRNLRESNATRRPRGSSSAAYSSTPTTGPIYPFETRCNGALEAIFTGGCGVLYNIFQG